MSAVVYPIRVLARLGIQYLLSASRRPTRALAQLTTPQSPTPPAG